MSFLRLNEDTGLVEVTPEGMAIKEVKSLYAKDKTKGKAFFKKCITYIYYTYKNRGTYSNHPLKKRQQVVVNKYCTDNNVKDFEDHESVKAVIKEYISLERTWLENIYEKIKADIEELVERMANEPWEIPKMMDVEISYEAKVEGKKELQTFTENKRTSVRINNHEAKSKILKQISTLLDEKKNLEERVEKERIQRNVGGSDYMYDVRQK